ncbi:MAG: peptide deformylase [Myxococcota bacterium]
MSAANSKIIHIGEPLLRQQSREIEQSELNTPWLSSVIDDMVTTMHIEGGVGIAAPQIGQSIQVAVVEIPENCSRYPNTRPFQQTVFINPRIEVLDNSLQGCWEGCLSVPGLRGLVYRPRKIRVSYLQRDGRSCQTVFEDFLATALQHEFDHLHGTLFVDRVRSTRLLSTYENYLRLWQNRPIPSPEESLE